MPCRYQPSQANATRATAPSGTHNGWGHSTTKPANRPRPAELLRHATVVTRWTPASTRMTAPPGPGPPRLRAHSVATAVIQPTYQTACNRAEGSRGGTNCTLLTRHPGARVPPNSPALTVAQPTTPAAK